MLSPDTNRVWLDLLLDRTVASVMLFRSFRWPLVAVAIALAAAPDIASAADDANEAKLNAKEALVSARVVYMKDGSYKAVTTKFLKAKHPKFEFSDDGPSTRPALLSVKVLGPDHFRLAVYGGGICWGVREEGMRGGGVATLYARRAGPAAQCQASSFRDDEFREHAQAWG